MVDVLPDVLAPGLRVVFCGSAAGRRSAAEGAYYAGVGNRFWPMLYRTGLAPQMLQPQQYREVLVHGIGLTDLAKENSGADSEIADAAYDSSRLRHVIEALAPAALAFNGKRAAQLFCGGGVSYGIQRDLCGTTKVFVLPSTSGAARGFWVEEPWWQLAEWLKSQWPVQEN